MCKKSHDNPFSSVFIPLKRNPAASSATHPPVPQLPTAPSLRQRLIRLLSPDLPAPYEGTVARRGRLHPGLPAERHVPRFIRPQGALALPSCVWPDVPLYGRTSFCVSVRQSVDIYLGGFQFLAVANNAAVDICLRVLAGTYVFSCPGTDRGVELLGPVMRQVTFYTLW